MLCGSRPLADFFEAAAVAHGDAKEVAKWMLRDLLRALSDREIEIDAAELTPESFATLMRLVDDGATTARSARSLIPLLVAEGGDPEARVRELGLEAVSDTAVIERAVDEVLAEHPDDLARYRSGEEKVLNFLMGQVMKRTQGKASPDAVRELLARKTKE